MNILAFTEKITGIEDPIFWIIGLPIVLNLFSAYVLVPLYFDKKFSYYLPLFNYDAVPGYFMDHIFGRPIVRLIGYCTVFICNDKTKKWHRKRILIFLKEEFYIDELNTPYKAERLLAWLFIIYFCFSFIFGSFVTIESILTKSTWETKPWSSLSYLVQVVLGLIFFPIYFVYLFVKKRISNKKTRDL
jgi:hypothetical protein